MKPRGTREGSGIPAREWMLADAAMNRKEMLLLALGILLLAAAVFSLLSLATYNPHDPPRADFPPNAIVMNSCGTAGAYLSSWLRWILGEVAYVLVFLMGLAGTTLLVRRHMKDTRLKVASALLLLVASACLADLIGANRVASDLTGPGGAVGYLLNSRLLTYCGWGAYVILDGDTGGGSGRYPGSRSPG